MASRPADTVRSPAECDYWYVSLQLTDIWRYFRHTWVTAYRSVPGRSMMILVRDAAAPCHPVIGIAALGSAVVQQSVRDEWIGWDSKRSLERLLTLSPQRLTKWTFQQIEDFLEGIYIRDIVRLGVIARREITNPTSEAVARLRAEAAKAMVEHREHPENPSTRPSRTITVCRFPTGRCARRRACSGPSGPRS